MLKKFISNLLQNKIRVLLILSGTFSWSLTMVKSGLIYRYGMGFWGPNGHDGVWHIALAESLSRGSWDMPMFSGESIKNYHLGFDILLAGLYKLTFIPVTTLYFQILPVIFALLIGFFAYEFVLEWKKSQFLAFWATFFVYFAGSWGYLITFIKNGQFGGESLFWSQQSISTLVNPPFAFSLLILFAGLTYLIKGLEENNRKFLAATSFLFGLLIQIKVYAGILVLAGLFLSGFTELLTKKGISILKVAVGALVLAVLLFSPLGKGVTNTLIFRPFWFLEEMMITPDHLNWQRFGEALINYRLAGNILKGIPAYSVAFIIFLVGNLGTRIIGLTWFWKKGIKLRSYKHVDVLVAAIVILGVLIPTFFIQSGNSWNSIQFFYYSLVFSGILAGVIFGEFIEKMVVNGRKINDVAIYHSKYILAVIIVILFTIPTTLGTLWYNYLPSRPPAKISNDELNALNFLKKQHKGTILTQPFDKNEADAAISNPPRPLYLYESTSYVAAFSGNKTYLEDEVNLDITGFDWKSRRIKEESFFRNFAPGFIKENNIDYIYVTHGGKQADFIDRGFEKILDNGTIQIYKVPSGI